ncbi:MULTISPECIES: hypothetical protein [unclassified Tolypothrix]|uniref:hypothetical protein n=1 Tax=unclassified Tolypothrix TaxID=2649714 RepID=UPI0005EAC3ED|nr:MULTISPECIES: hypothetical protein [unclassified Tolypothrix]BAY93456.1 hypothetical protein NIES3275_54950 [Microchaete diplosiphon NIES-3275]EKE99303.1 hypothetical protein FDUTEX481_10064 [Tolypothrix sp. PCC 7601]MBE9085221.1 hypothetical protein [Tolypothrix sp. LEGE 11397]UYD27300.1 hypothetical protein HGR01_04145 [Tolypothrix sp. PCC 7712]UYD36840.1 hypothetical protein HG267_14585 [Tolypothrix sp. PCC 7601]
MSYANRVGDQVIPPEQVVTGRVADYHDLVRWGPIISGVLVALVTQLILSALFGAIGAGNVAGSGAPRTIAPNVASNVGLWSTIGLLISLFTGGWVTTRACGPMNRNTALLNGAILWATTLALSSWLLASGVSGAFGVAASNAAAVLNQTQQSITNVPQNVPNVTAEQARDIAAATSRGLWWFVFGSLLGLLASLIGAVAGARKPRTTTYTTEVR